MDIAISKAWLHRILFGAMALVTGAGLLVEVLKPIYGLKSRRGVVPLLSLSYEQNVPTWYASALLLCCSLLLAGIAAGTRSKGERGAAHWWGLSAGFLYISFDEVVSIHEIASTWLKLGGVFLFSWVIPASILVAALGAVYIGFLRRLPKTSRNWFVLSGAIYVAGAVGMELPLGYWTSEHGTNNLGYALIDWIEETMELVGVNIFLLALVDYIGKKGWTAGVAGKARSSRFEGETRASSRVGTTLSETGTETEGD
jgi:hypothetical protein